MDFEKVIINPASEMNDPTADTSNFRYTVGFLQPSQDQFQFT